MGRTDGQIRSVHDSTLQRVLEPSIFRKPEEAMTPSLSLPRRTSDRPPEPPFGYGPVKVLLTSKWKNNVGYYQVPCADCVHIVTGDVMYSEWNSATREWGEWQMRF